MMEYHMIFFTIFLVIFFAFKEKLEVI